ncbi:MAG: NAD(P)H-dependent oxidoreductase [Rhodobacteraceae bacterium]|nr:NAD(P)H-dependent oxidoreductase [Paracoccaceae bacterium]
MIQPKIAVIFYSTYGTNHAVATAAAAAAREALAEVRPCRVAQTAPKAVVEGRRPGRPSSRSMSAIPEVSHADMEWADGYFFSCPNQYGNSASQLRVFIDTLGCLWRAAKLSSRTATATTSAQNPHVGQEATNLSPYTTLMHWGVIIAPPGYTDPSLFGASPAIIRLSNAIVSGLHLALLQLFLG